MRQDHLLIIDIVIDEVLIHADLFKEEFAKVLAVLNEHVVVSAVIGDPNIVSYRARQHASRMTSRQREQRSQPTFITKITIRHQCLAELEYVEVNAGTAANCKPISGRNDIDVEICLAWTAIEG